MTKPSSQIGPPQPGVHFTDRVIVPPKDAVFVKHVDASGEVFCWGWVSRDRCDAQMMATAVEFFEEHVDPPTTSDLAPLRRLSVLK